MRSTKRRLELGIAALMPVLLFGAAGQENHEVSSGPVAPTAKFDTGRDSDQKTFPERLQTRASRYELRQGDIFDITFPFTPEFNQTVTVQPDGYVALSSIGNLQVAGKTVPQITELLRVSYEKILHDPVVNIVLKDFDKPYFIASGELSRPGKYELRSDTTLTEAVAIAGGFTENSKHSEVYVFRRVDNGWVQLKKVDVKKMFQSADLAEDLHLQSGDMVFVPQNRYSKIKRYIPSPGVGMTVNPAY